MTASRPFDPSARRYAPHLAFPEYRHVLGETPHPRTHPRGHSFGLPEVSVSASLAADSWPSDETYLFGVDLYNFAFWWEAHEQWEALWHREEDRGGDTGSFLQGLIQLSASLLKWNAGNQRGFTQLAAKGCDRLQRVTGSMEGDCYMGVNPERFVAQYQAFEKNQQAAGQYRPPLLLLEGLRGR